MCKLCSSLRLNGKSTSTINQQCQLKGGRNKKKKMFHRFRWAQLQRNYPFRHKITRVNGLVPFAACTIEVTSKKMYLATRASSSLTKGMHPTKKTIVEPGSMNFEFHYILCFARAFWILWRRACRIPPINFLTTGVPVYTEFDSNEYCIPEPQRVQAMQIRMLDCFGLYVHRNITDSVAPGLISTRLKLPYFWEEKKDLSHYKSRGIAWGRESNFFYSDLQ